MSAIFLNQSLKVTWTCKDAVTGAVIDLTGQTMRVYVRSPGGVESVVNPVVENAVGGVISYTWAADALNEVGEWAAKPYIDGTKVPGTVLRFDVSSLWNK